MGKWQRGRGEEQKALEAGPAPLAQLRWCRGAEMAQYLLFSPLGPEALPTLRELTTNGKALGGPCRRAVGATVKR